MTFNIWWTIPALAILVGLLLCFAGLGRIFRLNVFGGLSRFLFGSVFLGAAAIAVLFGLNLQTYARLTHERIAAEVTLNEVEAGVYSASVRIPDVKGQLGQPTTYELTGNAFRMEAHFLKWKPWANISGVDSLYRLDRIQGRFDSVQAETATPPTPYSLAPAGVSTALEIHRMARENKFMQALDAIDARYLSGAAVPMADGAIYEIMAAQNGLVPRPKNEIAQKVALEWGVEQAEEGNRAVIGE